MTHRDESREGKGAARGNNGGGRPLVSTGDQDRLLRRQWLSCPEDNQASARPGGRLGDDRPLSLEGVGGRLGGVRARLLPLPLPGQPLKPRGELPGCSELRTVASLLLRVSQVDQDPGGLSSGHGGRGSSVGLGRPCSSWPAFPSGSGAPWGL